MTALKAKLRFYEEFALDAAVRGKLRARSRVILPEGHSPLRREDLGAHPALDWESVSSPWPGKNAPGLSLSVGHVFTAAQKERFLSSLRLTDFTDLNAPVETFDFSLLASRPRHFNSLRFQETTVTKICSWKEKGLAEADFFKSVPAELASYYPKVLSSVLTEKDFTYTMEHLRRFDLGRMVLEGSLGSSDWEAFYKRLADYFSRLPKRRVGRTEVQARLRELFIDKLRDRCEALKRFPGYSELARTFLATTGSSFEDRVRELSLRLERMIRETDREEVVFSHGDMSFCNVLYDLETGEIGFVDPRGKGPVHGCFLPLEYDLAKLSHSALGGYEALVLGRGRAEAPEVVRRSFLDFLAGFAVSPSRLRSYEASLFWSLLPLHLDDPSRLSDFMEAGERAFQAGEE